jgi:RNA 3'-terminal phosphate cyclase
LLEEIGSGATIDRHASDQIIPFASLADGTSRFQVPFITGHTETGGWLASLFLRAEVRAAPRTGEIATPMAGPDGIAGTIGCGSGAAGPLSFSRMAG